VRGQVTKDWTISYPNEPDIPPAIPGETPMYWFDWLSPVLTSTGALETERGLDYTELGNFAGVGNGQPATFLTSITGSQVYARSMSLPTIDTCFGLDSNDKHPPTAQLVDPSEANSAHYGFSCYVRCRSSAANLGEIMGIYAIDPVTQVPTNMVKLSAATAGKLALVSSPTSVVYTGSALLTPGVWQRVEASFGWDATKTASYTIAIDGLGQSGHKTNIAFSGSTNAAFIIGRVLSSVNADYEITDVSFTAGALAVYRLRYPLQEPPMYTERTAGVPMTFQGPKAFAAQLFAQPGYLSFPNTSPDLNSGTLNTSVSSSFALASMFGGTGSYTMTAWTSQSINAAYTGRTLVRFANSVTAGGVGELFRLRCSQLGAWTLTVASGTSKGIQTVSFTGSLPAHQNVWQHVALVMSGSGDGLNSSAIFYVNGQLVNRHNFVTRSSASLYAATSASLTFGIDLPYGTSNTVNRWAGKIGPVRFYGRAFSAADVLDRYVDESGSYV
jgi:hypothetical protein